MKCTGRITETVHNWETGKLRMTFELNEIPDDLNDIAKCEKLNITAEKYSEKRSLDANAYCWTLLHKLAAKVGRKAEDIYRDYIRDFGVCEIVPIRKDAITRWKQIWEDKGYGWLTEDMGECRNTKGYHNIKCFYGSSSYNTAEMSALIDAIVQDCKEQGINTMTLTEIERLKASWENQ